MVCVAFGVDFATVFFALVHFTSFISITCIASTNTFAHTQNEIFDENYKSLTFFIFASVRLLNVAHVHSRITLHFVGVCAVLCSFFHSLIIDVSLQTKQEKLFNASSMSSPTPSIWLLSVWQNVSYRVCCYRIILLNYEVNKEFDI